MNDLAYYPVSVFVNVAQSLAGRTIFYSISTGFAFWAGCSLGAGYVIEIMTMLESLPLLPIALLFLSSVDFFAAILVVTIVAGLFAFVRFSISYFYLLIPVISAAYVGYKLFTS